MVSSLSSSTSNAPLAPAALGSAISTAIAAKSLDAERQAGAAIVQLLDNAQLPTTPPQTGQLLDIQA